MNEKPVNKKPYQAPVVKKVHLEVKNSVLSTCRISGVDDQSGNSDCRVPAPYAVCSI